MTRQERLENLYSKYRESFTDREIVLGYGNIDTHLLLVGEAPGKDEVRLSRPFVGAAGKNLTEFLSIIGLHREDIYITNAIKYRLSKVNPQTDRVVNRPATKEDIIQNRQYLIDEIKIINPTFLVTLGNVPLKAITSDNSINIGAVHGELRPAIIDGYEYKLFPLYHPASVIYNSSLKSIYVSDIEKLKEIINIRQ